ncbi:hypothetical protein GCM10014715_37170 [Streptomyces spiralis]|uniref:Uncharacterized protein n=2 Tax=Streptomyces spiralis TaxID=66376 RepID=A0A918ZYX1_9ACTN|nr:hypothetical protein GCM10014715_37170 [Streptomyces spiralis]
MIPRRRHLGRVRRRVDARLMTARTRLMNRFFLPRRAGRAARLGYAAVLDGQTVNLHAELPDSVREADRAEILLSRRHQRFRVPARVYAARDGRLLMDAAVLLGAAAGGVSVTPGRWKLRLRVSSGRRSRTLPLLLVEQTTPLSGSTGPMKYSPITADRYRLGRTLRGDARVVCTKAAPAAEVINVYIEHARIEVDLRILGVRADAPWAELVAAGRSVECPLDEVEPDVWRLEVPLAEMLPSTGQREHWNVMVHTDGRAPLRLARRLHDVQTPERVFAMRKILVSPLRGTLMTIEPRYTPAGNLRFTCSDESGAE